MSSFGIVTIGRNEGQRLERCLRSVVGRTPHIVYVDSGSTDGSVAMAQSLGVDVVELDMTIPFTMARGRNAGYRRLFQIVTELTYVQFIDGDCEVVEGWLTDAIDALDARQDVAVVSGRRRERHREASVYNRLIDMEWDTPVGETHAVLGDLMIRAEALRQVDGFNPAMIAGEEAEMCLRLRRHDWKIFRLNAEMTIHDAALTRFGQWWKRTVRAGHAYAENARMHGRGKEKHQVRDVWRIWFWALLLPLVAVAAAWPTGGWSLLLLVLYAVPLVRAFRYRLVQHGDRKGDALLYSVFALLGKWPNLIGVMTYYFNRLRNKQSALIEYK